VESEGWSVWRRLLYLAGAPLIPWIRLRRLLGQLRAYPHPRPHLLAMLPPILVGLVSHTAGECAAYALGEGSARMRRMTFELDRRTHLRAEDR